MIDVNLSMNGICAACILNSIVSFIQYHLNCIFHVLSSEELGVTETRLNDRNRK